jgi:hypothetical protein
MPGSVKASTRRRDRRGAVSVVVLFEFAERDEAGRAMSRAGPCCGQ